GKGLFSWLDYRVILGLLLSAGLIYYALRERNREPRVSYGLLWFFIWLVPVSNIFYPLPFYMTEHYLDMSLAGLLMAGVVLTFKALERVLKKQEAKITGCMVFIFTAALFCSLTYRQNELWKNPVIFYEHMIKHNPKSVYGHMNLACEYREAGDIERAYSYSLKTIELDDKNAEAHNNLGFFYISRGEVENAIASFEKAISLKPNYGAAYANLGNLYSATGDLAEAVQLYKKAIEINPNDASAYYNLAVTSFVRKRYSLAKEYLQKALELGFENAHPDFIKALQGYR
ncbi:MAG: tetratricopeptide repeat protein, partial [Candidatus Omnitrophica bacterium]|nr:tetratricopeptide repeat protein [Candidatus Omnitrophota bacterium]